MQKENVIEKNVFENLAHRVRGNRGFTLIELLVVVLIIGILAAVALPQYQKAVLKSKYIALMTTANAVYKAERIYYLTHGTYTASTADLDIKVNLTDPQYSCNINTAYSEIYCAVNQASLGYHIYFGSGKHACWVEKNTAQEDLWKKVCQSLTGQTGYTWNNKTRFEFPQKI